ncbi:MAG: hypothetical protein Kow00127_16050 [Bacteroidales bacterium]
MLQNRVSFESAHELRVSFVSLVINVDSIEKLYPGGMKAFFLEADFGSTNGNLFIMSEMSSYPATIYEFMDRVLVPAGFQKTRDWVLGEDSVAPMAGHGEPDYEEELYWTREAGWINSRAYSPKGSIVWSTTAKHDMERHCMKLNGNQRRQSWTYWFDKHPLLKDYRLKVLSNSTVPFDLDRKRYDIVDLETYITVEPGRLPLVISTQFGRFPEPEDNFPPGYNGYVAMLSRSMLSGLVSGLAIRRYNKGEFSEPVVLFENTLNQFSYPDLEVQLPVGKTAIFYN